MGNEVRVLHYLNQFFGGIGGEDKADTGLVVRPGAVGPGIPLEMEMGREGRIVATVICGDNYVNLKMSEARAEFLEAARQYRPQVLVAGPAFNAGRYGIACGELSRAVSQVLGIPAVTAMYPENPAASLYKGTPQVWILTTSDRASSMTLVLPKLAAVALKVARGERMGPAAVEGYIPTGRRVLEFAAEPGADRAIRMLLAKLKGEPWQTEIPIERLEEVPPAPPVKDLSHARLALITTSGMVPAGNPDEFRMFNATSWRSYPLPEGLALRPKEWEFIHGGFNTAFAHGNPNLVLPLDALSELAGKVFGQLHGHFYSITGVGTSLTVARRVGEQIAGSLQEAHVDAALLVAT